MIDEQDALDVRTVLAGGTDAFEGIVRRWQGPLLTLAFRFCRDRARAEDLAQEALWMVYSSLHQWRGDGSFSSWLFSVATNVYRSKQRRRGPATESLHPPDGDDSREPSQSPPVEDASCDAVRRAVAALPEKYRDAMILYYFHEMNVADAARSLGVKVGTLKARLHRARALLRSAISERPAEDG
jgi:RNA polymerase sigma-70 factor (ECF subfamily)